MQLKRRFDNVKGKRDWFGYFPDNAHCLPGIPRSAKNTDRILQVLCSFYNAFHASKAKNCSLATSQKRKYFLLSFFRIVHTRFQCDPRNLQSKHVEYYFRIQIAKLKRNGTSQMSITQIMRNETTYLNFFTRWIGKAGLVRNASYYLKQNNIDSKMLPIQAVRASNISQEGKEQLIREAFKKDPILGSLILAIAQFGLRPREACHLKPMTAFEQNEDGWYLSITEGSKGGRPRKIQFRDQSQVWTMKILQEIVMQQGTERISYLNETPLQTQTRLKKFNGRKMNLQQNNLQGSVYGLRHAFAQELLWDLGKIQPINEAKQMVSEALGHARPEITGVYVGSAVKLELDVIQNFVRLIHLEPLEAERINLGCQILRQVIYRDAAVGLFMVVIAFKTENISSSIDAELTKILTVLCAQYPCKGKAGSIKKRISGLLDLPEEEVEKLLILMEDKFSALNLAREVIKPFLNRLMNAGTSGKELFSVSSNNQAELLSEK